MNDDFEKKRLALEAVMEAFWPVPIDPVAWEPEADAGFTGHFASNERMSAMSMSQLNGETGPETIVVGQDGKLYTGVISGKILRMNPDLTGIETFADTGGRVLGLAFDAAGTLLVADAQKGLLSINPDGTFRTLLDGGAGPDSLGFINALVIARSGTIYVSVATTRFRPAVWGQESVLLDTLEHGNTGQVLEFNPNGGTWRIVARGFHFSNGVELSQDEQFLFVVETCSYRIWKIAITADDIDIYQSSPQAKILLDNLPGYPDNLTRGQNGKIWFGMPQRRTSGMDMMAQHPGLRKMLLRLPRSLWPLPKQYGHVAAFNEDGDIVVDLQDPSGKLFGGATGATETRERLYLQSQLAPGLSYIDQEF
ncbi:MAG: SMP-30/gluconolactonase/LRE family protein [Acidobacteriaceae bacterium]